jgi:ribosomal protein L7/L12
MVFNATCQIVYVLGQMEETLHSLLTIAINPLRASEWLGDLDVNSTSMLGEAFLSSVRRFGDEAIKDNPEQLVDVFLHDLGNDRIKALAVIRRETGLSLNKVRKLIDPLPCVLIDNIPLIRAEKIVQNLRSKGASASVSD